MKIYVLYEGEYSDREAVAAYTSRERAVAVGLARDAAFHAHMDRAGRAENHRPQRRTAGTIDIEELELDADPEGTP